MPRNTEKEKAYYAAIEAQGHMLERDPESGYVKYHSIGDFHGGPRCELCEDMWCQHCPHPISPCPCSVIDSTCEVVTDSAGENVLLQQLN